jgi:hypothetical protein
MNRLCQYLGLTPFSHVVVQITQQPGTHVVTTTNVFVPSVAGGFARVDTMNAGGAVAMTLRSEYLLEGGGANRQFGVDRIVLGNVGNLQADNFVVNYPVPAPAPPPPGNVAGTEREDPDGRVNPALGFPAPMVDTVNVAAGAEPTGGNTPFRGNSAQVVLGAGPGGNGERRRVTSLDAPAFIWDINHPTTGNPWGTTVGGNNFREWIVAYSTTYPRNYLALARADWTVTVVGNNTGAGLWGDTGSAVGTGGFIVAGYPQAGNAAGVQVLGLSFVREVRMIPAP